ncbi:rho gtpase-activating protein 68f [Anaeramoeba ignava]|uniref:Rho gtpase-activating protein 68f n=1 Tax=Anaeramoeba ignava TaxID=1746090 RepID=A0A9Q0LQ21_ANAIG|nr:rho gtpase-activating protein 68f [Anaeramoeba ignava]|eukprot:Anaeramoba_ignava/a219530_69.p1 GENE.a219530_69~~a219530_69.p1  ORF type:complete len:708 (+),score=191.15 a219530_69:54-2177(+)
MDNQKVQKLAQNPFFSTRPKFSRYKAQKKHQPTSPKHTKNYKEQDSETQNTQETEESTKNNSNNSTQKITIENLKNNHFSPNESPQPKSENPEMEQEEQTHRNMNEEIKKLMKPIPIPNNISIEQERKTNEQENEKEKKNLVKKEEQQGNKTRKLPPKPIPKFSSMHNMKSRSITSVPDLPKRKSYKSRLTRRELPQSPQQKSPEINKDHAIHQSLSFSEQNINPMGKLKQNFSMDFNQNNLSNSNIPEDEDQEKMQIEEEEEEFNKRFDHLMKSIYEKKRFTQDQELTEVQQIIEQMRCFLQDENLLYSSTSNPQSSSIGIEKGEQLQKELEFEDIDISEKDLKRNITREDRDLVQTEHAEKDDDHSTENENTAKTTGNDTDEKQQKRDSIELDSVPIPQNRDTKEGRWAKFKRKSRRWTGLSFFSKKSSKRKSVSNIQVELSLTGDHSSNTKKSNKTTSAVSPKDSNETEDQRTKSLQAEITEIEKLKMLSRTLIQQRNKIVSEDDGTNIFGVPLSVLSNRSPDSQFLIPDALQKIFDFLDRKAPLTKSIYRMTPSSEDVQNLKKGIDSGTDVDFSKVDIHSVASAFKLFFRSLPESILTRRYLQIFSDTFSDDYLLEKQQGDFEDKHQVLCEISQILNELPNINKIILNRLIRHLAKVGNFFFYNQMSSANLSICFSPTLQIPQQVLLFMILNWDDILIDFIQK